MIRISSLVHVYDQGRSLKFPDWEIGDMEQWLLLGASGSGKSTLLNIIAGLLKPGQGEVLINGTDLYALSARERDSFRGKHIGIVFQKPHLIRSLDVLDNLELAAVMAGLPVDHERNLSLLADLGISELAKNYPDQLSQGQLQRVSVARALVNKPDLLIADEPTSSLDDENASQVIRMLAIRAKDNGAALLIATHDARVRDHFTKTYLL
ncbi:putative ABC transport system ATP-binding protein [Pedobacter suwonensis]|uniref:Putative ABC transport system ATP-binding protein n=1 Tax=Pedobacter suwonensis TaxID=332999 RepID=A0A1I0T571_9SPHI|nr:ABC transporter ATP-binding protein [Pedobacter suwonensis]SFA46837.1 putative ABC transport system ATP-binding protein [Pedobacter suwonensis]